MSTPNYIFQGKGHRPVDAAALKLRNDRLQKKVQKTTPQAPARVNSVEQPAKAQAPKGTLVTVSNEPQPANDDKALSGLGQWLVKLPVVRTVIQSAVILLSKLKTANK